MWITARAKKATAPVSPENKSPEQEQPPANEIISGGEERKENVESPSDIDHQPINEEPIVRRETPIVLSEFNYRVLAIVLSEATDL